MKEIVRVSVSDLLSFSSCRRQWLWGKTYGRKTPIPAFWLGSAVHAGLEGYYKNDRKLLEALRFQQTFIDTSLQKIGQGLSDIYWREHLPEFQELARLSQGMVKNYAEYDSQAPEFRGRTKAVESFYSALVPTYLKGYSIKLVGKVDLILGTPQGDVIIDHKTASRAPFIDALEVDGQLTAYAYLHWKATGKVPRLVYFNFLYKGMPEPPDLIRSGTALSKSKSQFTTPKMYRRALQDYEFDSGPYEEFIEYLGENVWGQYFLRVGISRSLLELQNFERRLKAIGTDIVKAKKAPKKWSYSSPSMYSCQYCDFTSACKSEDDGGDSQALLDHMFTTERLY